MKRTLYKWEIELNSEFLKKAILRHFEETREFIDTLTDGKKLSDLLKQDIIEPDQILFKMPIKEGRSLGQILLHMIRSLEFYMKGIAINQWEPLPYTLNDYPTVQEILLLYDSVTNSLIKYLDALNDNMLQQSVVQFNSPATKQELLLEMLEHSIHHRGQLSVYYRLLGLKLPTISYIV